MRVALAALLALAALVVIPGVASAQSITNFYVSRQPTLDVNPANAFGFPLNPAQATLGPPAIVGAPTQLQISPVNYTGSFPPNGAQTNPIANPYGPFIRSATPATVSSPGSFPSLDLAWTFSGTTNATGVQNFTVKLPPGQVGNPFATRQCQLQPGGVANPGANTQASVATCPISFALNNPLPGETDPIGGSSLVGFASAADAGGNVYYGFIVNADSRTLPSPEFTNLDRTAPGALGVAFFGPCGNATCTNVFGPGGVGAFAANFIASPTGVLPNVATVAYAHAGPLFVGPRAGGDYGVDQTVDLRTTSQGGFFNTPSTPACGGQCPIVAVHFHINGVSDRDSPSATSPPASLPALPFPINPTSCQNATSTTSATFANGAASNNAFQTFPQTQNDPTVAATVAQVNGECAGYPWNGQEFNQNAGGNGLVPNGLAVLHNTKVSDDDNGRTESPDQYSFRFSTPTRHGLPYQSHYKEIDVHLPGPASGSAAAAIKALEAGGNSGTTLSPALASKPGFTICTEQQFDAGAAEAANCPDVAKIGDFSVHSPLLDGNRNTQVNPFAIAGQGCDNINAEEDPCANLAAAANFGPCVGSIAAALPLIPACVAGGGGVERFGGDLWAGPQVEGHPNQFRIFGELTDGGVTRIKLQGVATADKQTGQIDAVFDDLPQLPVWFVEQRFFGGDHAALVNPDTCGQFLVKTEVTPWASVQGAFPGAVTAAPAKAQPDDKFQTSFDGNGAGCPAQKPFAPELAFLSDPLTAGQDTSLTTTIRLPDRSENLTDASVSLPDGLLGALGTVPMCGRDLASTGDCPADSQIGTVDVVEGNGGDPLHVPGKVYFSRPGAEGEVARITIVVPAKVGPFDLHHTIVNELAIKLRGQDGNVGLDNVGKDKLPTIVEGIPVRVREIQLKIDRDHFLRNPLVCDALEGSGVFGALDGRTATVKAPFQATGCDTLAFTPRLNATVGSADNPAKVGHHPTFTTVVTQADHQAAIKKSVVTLPQGLIANPTALGNLCSVQQAQDNACPDSTRVGTAKAISPLVPDALTGAVFVAENPSGGLPRLVMRVSNSLLNVPIEATTTLKSTGQLVTTLDNLPAAPVTSFELTIDGGSKGLFTVSNSLCSNPTVAGTFSSHTGQSFDDSSPVNIVGDCKPVPDPNAAASKRKPSLTVSVRRLGSQPLVTLRAHSASSGRRLRSLRVVLPSRLVVSSAKVRKGLSVLVGGKKLSRSAYSLSRHGVLSVRVPRGGSSQIIVSLRSGSIRANRALRGLARRHRTLPRLVFTGRVVDVKNTRFSYRVRVRPNR